MSVRSAVRSAVAPARALEAMERDGDFAKRYLVNPVLLRLLCRLPDLGPLSDLGGPFDAVVASMVLPAIPEQLWPSSDLSTYLNELIHLGCRLTEIVEPGLSPEA